ncbi:MbnP family protein [Aquimarina sp. 2201CG1-2-11]|uniref:MbnP family protein n=1 Tax=Aquimarina discodermiae TaxID=3231043 RepID=UPI003462B2A4
MIKKFTLALFVCTVLLSCKSDDDKTTDEVAKAGSLNLEFSNSIGSEPVVLSDKISYTNGSNESYTISELKYIISNIVLIKEDGQEFVYPLEESYFLVNEEVSDSKKIVLKNIDPAEYSKIKFGFGVDQSKYPLNGVDNFVPTAEEGNMLWSWSAGYIFLKFEGTFTPQGGETDNFLIHVGSHGTTLDNYKEITVELSEKVSISEKLSPIVSIQANIAKILDGTNTHSLAAKKSIQVDPENAPKIAENVTSMFSVAKVSN